MSRVHFPQSLGGWPWLLSCMFVQAAGKSINNSIFRCYSEVCGESCSSTHQYISIAMINSADRCSYALGFFRTQQDSYCMRCRCRRLCHHHWCAVDTSPATIVMFPACCVPMSIVLIQSIVLFMPIRSIPSSGKTSMMLNHLALRKAR